MLENPVNGCAHSLVCAMRHVLAMVMAVMSDDVLFISVLRQLLFYAEFVI